MRKGLSYSAAGNRITSYRATSSRSHLLVGLCSVVFRLAIAADRRAYISYAESVQSTEGGYLRKAAAALCSSDESGFGSVLAHTAG